MLVKKTWFRKIKASDANNSYRSSYMYTGYFLFGIIPLYIVREGI